MVERAHIYRQIYPPNDLQHAESNEYTFADCAHDIALLSLEKDNRAYVSGLLYILEKFPEEVSIDWNNFQRTHTGIGNMLGIHSQATDRRIAALGKKFSECDFYQGSNPFIMPIHYLTKEEQNAYKQSNPRYDKDKISIHILPDTSLKLLMIDLLAFGYRTPELKAESISWMGSDVVETVYEYRTMNELVEESKRAYNTIFRSVAKLYPNWKKSFPRNVQNNNAAMLSPEVINVITHYMEGLKWVGSKAVEKRNETIKPPLLTPKIKLVGLRVLKEFGNQPITAANYQIIRVKIQDALGYPIELHVIPMLLAYRQLMRKTNKKN